MVMVMEMCLHKDGHGQVNVPSQGCHGYVNVPSQGWSWLDKCAFVKIVSVRGMCLQKESYGEGNVPPKQQSHGQGMYLNKDSHG